MPAALIICWCIALVLAAVHLLEHGTGRSEHALAWRALPFRARFWAMITFFSAVLVAVCAWWVVPAVTVGMLAAADLAGAVHLIRHWRHIS